MKKAPVNDPCQRQTGVNPCQRQAGVNPVEIAQKQRHLFLLGKVKENRHLTKAEVDELAEHEEMTKKRKRATKDERRATNLAESQIIETQKEAAEYAEVDTRTIRRWVKADMPQTKDGHYIKSMLDFYKNNEGKQPTENKVRHQKAAADLKELKVKLVEKQLVEIEKEVNKRIEQMMIPRILACRKQLRAVPRRIGPQLVGKSARKIIEMLSKEMKYCLGVFAGENVTENVKNG